MFGLKRANAGLSMIALIWATDGLAQVQPSPEVDRTALPITEQPYQGKIGATYRDSVPYNLSPVRAPKDAPNVIIVLTDDVGFGAASTFGGPVPTPNLDRLAARGLRYTRFHTTAMCSPTRAALLTGRNHHAVGSGTVTDNASGYPGYNGAIPRSAASIARILRDNGYSTAMVGKHHNVPSSHHTPSSGQSAGAFEHWPTGLGFEHFFGFIGGDTDQWRPYLYRGTEAVDDQPPAGETLDRLLFDDAIAWIRSNEAISPQKPFFLYVAPGTAHAPHQAPPAWIAKFRGKFDQGWDALRDATLRRQIAAGIVPRGTKLTPRPDVIPAWSTRSADERAADARMMEVFAGMLAYQDAQFGRLLDELDRTGKADNTLIVFIEGDNGGSAEGGLAGSLNEIGAVANGVVDTVAVKKAAIDLMGGPETYQIYPVGWGWATNTPFQWNKQVASHLGGTRNGMVISWPTRIADKGGIRSEFTHVVDVAPTILEAAGVPQPKTVEGVVQQPVHGISMTYTFARGATEKSRTQYFEMRGNRAIYKDGWMASTTPVRLPWKAPYSEIPLLDYKWELYDLRNDFSQSNDLAAKNPARLEELKAAWEEEARRNQVFPLDDRHGDRSNGVLPQSSQRFNYNYWGNGISVRQSEAPRLGISSFVLNADIVIPPGGGVGVLAASGSKFAGWSFYFDKGRPAAVHVASHQEGDAWTVVAPEAIRPGPARIRYEFESAGRAKGGTLQIFVNDVLVANGLIGRTALLMAGLSETFDTGRDTGTPVIDYGAGGMFNGLINSISVEIKK